MVNYVHRTIELSCQHCYKRYVISANYANRSKFCSRICARHFGREHREEPVYLLREYIMYDPFSGSLHWRKSPNGRAPVGQLIQTANDGGYIHFKLHNVHYMAHIAAWAIFHGIYPTHLIDHKDGICGNNRIDNLRPATHSENIFNQPSRSATGCKGVYKTPNGYRAQFPKNGANTHLGYFDTIEEAREERCKAEKQHGVSEFCEDGRRRT